MAKLILSALWICAITLASSYVAASWKANGTLTTGDGQALRGLNYEKTAPINVPIIKAGSVNGYVVAQFVYTADAGLLNRLTVPPDPFMLDRAFRTIFSDEDIDVAHLERFDLAALTEEIRAEVNARFGTEIIRDVLVEQFTFVTKDEVRAQAGATAAVPVVTADEAIRRPDADAAGDARAEGH